MKNLILALYLTCAGCASIIHSDRQTVHIYGGPEKGETKIISPDGIHIIDDGRGSIILTRTRDDIPVTIECAGKKSHRIIHTNLSIGWGVFGNILLGAFFLVGFPIDVLGDRAYNIASPIDISNFCEEATIEKTAANPQSL